MTSTAFEDQFSPEPTPQEEEAWREMEKRRSSRSDAGSEPVAWLSCDPDTGKPVWSEDCVCEDNVYSPAETGTVGRPVIFADAPFAAHAQPPKEISRTLLGVIVDEVFDGACEDTTPIEDIYRVIVREHGAQQPVSGADGLTPGIKETIRLALIAQHDAALAETLRESAEIIAAIQPEHAPENIRWPIVDELHGFASMIDHARRIEENNDVSR